MFICGSCSSMLGMLGAQTATELFILTNALAFALNDDDEQMSFENKIEVLLREFKATVILNREEIKRIENWNCEYFFFSGMIADFSCNKITVNSPQDLELKKIFNELGTWNFWLQQVNNIFLDVEQQEKTNMLHKAVKQCFDETIGYFSNNEKREKYRQKIEDENCLDAKILSDGFLFVCLLSDFLKKVEKMVRPRTCNIL